MVNAQHQIYIILDWLHREAILAYWSTHSHCGEPFRGKDHCGNCTSFEMCEAEKHVETGLDNLKVMVRE